jgi:peptidoglycan endopeptidase LytE
MKLRRYFMMRRRIFLWMGLIVLFTPLFLCREGLAKETSANQKIAKSAISSSTREAFYTVRKGDTQAGIARKTGVSVAELRELNRLRGSALRIGQRLALKKEKDLPSGHDETVAPAEHMKKAVVPDLDEREESDGGIIANESGAGIEMRKQDNESLLGNWSTPDEPKLLVKVALGFLGAPYRLGGSSVKGIDCSGFVKKIYEVFNIDLPRTAFEQSHIGMSISRKDLSEGDLLFFRTRRPVGHVGIYVGDNKFVHASSWKRGVRIDTLDTPYFDKRFVRAVRLKGQDDGL